MEIRTRARVGTGLMAGLVMVSAIVAVGQDGGNPAEAVQILSGAVWLSSTHVGQLTLLDGSAEQVAAQIQVASYRDTIDAVH